MGPQPRETLRKRRRIAVDHHGAHYSVYKALFHPYFRIQMTGVLVHLGVCVCVISSSLGVSVWLPMLIINKKAQLLFDSMISGKTVICYLRFVCFIFKYTLEKKIRTHKLTLVGSHWSQVVVLPFAFIFSNSILYISSKLLLDSHTS